MSETPAERAVNLAAEFMPATAGDATTLPAVNVGGAVVFAYVKDDVLCVSVDLDGAEALEVGGRVAMRVTVQGTTVFEEG